MWIFTLLFNVIRQHKLKTDSSSKSKIEAELVKTRTNSNDQNQIPAQVTPMIRESWVKRVYSMVCSNVSDWVSANIVKTNSFFFFFWYLPGKVIFQIKLSCTHSSFLLQLSYISTAFGPRCRQGNLIREKLQNQQMLFHLETRWKCWKAFSATTKIL